MIKKTWFVGLLILLQVLLPVFTVQAANFQDVANDYVYSTAIQDLKEKGIVQGYDGVHFGPERLITRAELLKIALEGAKIDTLNWKNKPTTFSDLDVTHSLRQYVLYAKEHNIISGYADGTYKPDQPTTRAEAIKMLLNINAVLVPATVSSLPYQDLRLADPLAPFVFAAREKRVIPGKYQANKLGTGELIQRGEVAEMMYRLLYLKEHALSIYPEQADIVTIVPGNHSTTSFAGITIQTPIAKTMVANTYYPITVDTAGSLLRVIIENSANEQSIWEYKPSQGRATFDLFFPTSGQYRLGLVADDRAQVLSLPIAIVPVWQFGTEAPTEKIEGAQFAADGDARVWLLWNGSTGRTFLHLECSQGAQSVERNIVSSGEKWELDFQMFIGFEEGTIDCSVSQAIALSTVATKSAISRPYTWSFPALTHHFRDWDKAVLTIDDGLPLFTDATSLRLHGRATVTLSNYAAIILPSGNVQVFALQAGEQTVLNSGNTWELNLELKESGVYFLELNNADGIAVLNTPIYRKTGIPVLPDFLALEQGLVINNKSPLTITEKLAFTEELVNGINALRTQLGKPPVVLDPANLSAFAQAHADDMATQNYLLHQNKDHKGPEQRKLPFDIATPVGENIALSVNINSIDEGLKRSAVHRFNMLDPRWTRVGIGLARSKDGTLYAVQEFSTRSFSDQPMTSEEKSALATRTLERINVNRATAQLNPLVLGNEYTLALQAWERNPKQPARELLVPAGMQRGRILSDTRPYSQNLPAELALQAAVTEVGISKMAMGVSFIGETMYVAVVLY